MGSLIAISEESSSKTEEINKIFEELDKNFRELKMDVSIDKLKTVLQIPRPPVTAQGSGGGPGVVPAQKEEQFAEVQKAILAVLRYLDPKKENQAKPLFILREDLPEEWLADMSAKIEEWEVENRDGIETGIGDWKDKGKISDYFLTTGRRKDEKDDKLNKLKFEKNELPRLFRIGGTNGTNLLVLPRMGVFSVRYSLLPGEKPSQKMKHLQTYAQERILPKKESGSTSQYRWVIKHTNTPANTMQFPLNPEELDSKLDRIYLKFMENVQSNLTTRFRLANELQKTNSWLGELETNRWLKIVLAGKRGEAKLAEWDRVFSDFNTNKYVEIGIRN